MEKENAVIPETTEEEVVEETIQEKEEVSAENVKTESKAAENRCPKCQALIEDGQAFCPECGEMLKKLCSRCGTELQNEQVFCPSCGQRAQADDSAAPSSIEQFNQGIVNKGNLANKNKKILSILGIVAVVAAVAAYFVFQNAKVSQYKENAKMFCSDVLTAAANLEDIGNEVQDEWYDYIYDRWSIYDSVDEAVAGALINMSSEIDTAKSQKEDIDILYSKLKKPVNGTAEIEELCEAVKVLYDAYEKMYDCVTDPSGNYTSFKSDFGDCDSETVDAYEDLKELCDDLN